MTITQDNTSMKMEVITMTPEWAQEILATWNTKNRYMRPGVVQKYAHSIKTGQWKLTPEVVAVGSDGVLLNGQHRLAAVIETNMPVQIAMATNCDPEIFSVLDTGVARAAADVLHMKGASSSTSMAAGLKSYLFFQQYPDKMWTGAGVISPTHSEIGALFDERQDDAAFASSVASSTHAACRQANKSALIAFALLCLDAGHDQESISEFCRMLGTAIGLTDRSPILRLRQALTNGVLANRRPLNQIQLACLIKAFNYWNEGVALKLFKVPSIPPMPTVLP